ncbi:MAG: hypothetical protein Q9227_008639 [Pyrenula ochraceoflavens]
MGSSARKRREKKKDFQPVLNPPIKPTPLSALNVPPLPHSSPLLPLTPQRTALSLSTPLSTSSSSSSSSQHLLKHISLLSSPSPATRLTSLSTLSNSTSPVPLPTLSILSSAIPLLLDANPKIRAELRRFLRRKVPLEELADYVGGAGGGGGVVMYVRAGLTHLSAGIRSDAVKLLGWLLDGSHHQHQHQHRDQRGGEGGEVGAGVGREMVESRGGGFVKVTRAFVAMLGWTMSDGAHVGNAGGEADAEAVRVFGRWLEVGLLQPEDGGDREGESWDDGTGLVDYWAHCVQRGGRTDVYGYLGLFGGGGEGEEEMMMEDVGQRVAWFGREIRGPVAGGVEGCRKVGGEVGRAAGEVAKVMERVSWDEGG